MPRVSRAQAHAHREAIAEAAARLFRERGFDGVSVAEAMSAAGLTHGGFYGHFQSKDALAAEACERSFAKSAEAWRATAAAAASPEAALAEIVGNYLRDGAETVPRPACAAVALAGDVARCPPEKPVHNAFAEGVEALLAALEGPLAQRSETPRADAAVLLATLVGALGLARATRGTPLAAEILAAARAHLIPQGS